MAQQSRPPIVTILGHVDHGKTTLLDYIRKATVAKGEFGGITQAIGAYQAQAEGKTITFIDTPGHAAFEKMRSRGAQVADIAVLVVAVDDGVMPQTVEAIKHIQNAKIPMMVAVNKIDLPAVNIQAQIEKIKRQLSDNNVLIEQYGGDVPIVELSATTGQGVQDLLSTINLIAEINELKGDPSLPASGVVIEAKLDKFRGAVATVLVRNGTLHRGDTLIAGTAKGKVRGMFDFQGKPQDHVGPSQPAEILGFETVPEVGAHLGEETPKKAATQFASSLIDKLKEEQSEILNVVVKADNQGSLEAIEDIIKSFNQDKRNIQIIYAGTGDIVDTDVEVSDSVKGIVLGFNVKVVPTAAKRAETANVLVRTYKIIYELADELKEVVEGMLLPGKVEEVFGRAQIIAEFLYGKNERIAGCHVVEGVISKGPKIRIVRNGEITEEAKIKSLKKVKEEVSKIEKGQECGIIFDHETDFKIGDVVESYRIL